MVESVESRLARIEARAEARDEAMRESRQTHERALADINMRLDRFDSTLDALAERLGDAIVNAFERATEQFASRETLTWWTTLLTRGLLFLVGLGVIAVTTGHWWIHLQ